MADAAMEATRPLSAGADRFASAILARAVSSRAPSTRLAIRLVLRRQDGGLALDACRNLPDWLAWPPARRERLALLAGASAIAPDLIASLDGTAMRRVAGWVGEETLGRLLDLCEEDATGRPVPESREALTALGRSILRTVLPASPSLFAALGLAADAAAVDPARGQVHAARAAAAASVEGAA